MRKTENKTRFDQYDETEWLKIAYDYDTDGYVVMHKAHGSSERGANLIVAFALSRRGEAIELQPVARQQGVKSLDATRNQTLWEFKIPTTLNGKNAIQSSVKIASGQNAEHLLIAIREEHEIQEIINGFYAAFQMGRALSIKIVELLFENETFVALNRQQIDKKEFEEILRKHKRQSD